LPRHSLGVLDVTLSDRHSDLVVVSSHFHTQLIMCCGVTHSQLWWWWWWWWWCWSIYLTNVFIMDGVRNQNNC